MEYNSIENKNVVHKFIDKLVIYENIMGQVYYLKSMVKGADGHYDLILSDTSGELPGKLDASRFQDSLMQLVGCPVEVNAVIMDSPSLTAYAKVKGIVEASKDSYRVSDLLKGLTAEKVDEYIQIIHNAMQYIKHEGYRQLCECALNDVSLKKLGELPATLAYHCKYQGGALAATAMITRIAMDIGILYIKHGNGIYGGTINWSLLLTGALLNSYGVIDYLTPAVPFKKTIAGVNRGYMSVLQSSIETLIHAYSIPIEEKELGELLNILGCSVVRKTSVRAAHKEGVILRHVVTLFAELDMMDAGLSNHIPQEGEDGYYYEPSIRSYLAINQ